MGELRSETAANWELEKGAFNNNLRNGAIYDVFDRNLRYLESSFDKFKKSKITSPGFELRSSLFKRRLLLSPALKENLLGLSKELRTRINEVFNRELSAQLEDFFKEFERIIALFEDSINKNNDLEKILEIMKTLESFLKNPNSKTLIRN